MKTLRLIFIALAMSFSFSGCIQGDGGKTPISDKETKEIVMVASGEIGSSAHVIIENYPERDKPWYPMFVQGEMKRTIAITGTGSEKQKEDARKRADFVKANVTSPKAVDDFYGEEIKKGEIIRKNISDAINNLVNDAIKLQEQAAQNERRAFMTKACVITGIALFIASLTALAIAIRMGIKPILGICGIIGSIALLFVPQLPDVKWFLPSLCGIIVFVIVAYIFEIFWKKRSDKKKELKDSLIVKS